jgi:hypothetical protein
MELNPMMLTILGVVAGVLIVIILVTAALRIHTSRSRRRRNEASGGHGRSTTDKVSNLFSVTILQLNLT